MSRQVALTVSFILVFILTAWVVPLRPASATHITSTLLITLNTGFNDTQPSGRNPLIIVLANNTLRIGSPRSAPTFTVSLSNPQVQTHNFAIYRQGEVPNQCCANDPDALARTGNVNSITTTTSKTFSLPRAIYEYYCEFHITTMLGQIKAINPDVDGDSNVDLGDLIDVYLHQFSTDLTYDIDLDGNVDLEDLIIVYIHQFI